MEFSSPLTKRLQELLDQADYDAALAELTEQITAPRELPELTHFEAIRQACLTCEALDYGGRYAESAIVIGPYENEARQRIDTFLSPSRQPATLNPKEADDINELCWVLIHCGMCVYRSAKSETPKFEKATELFQKSRDAFLRLEQAGFIHMGGSARAWYCIGLVHRELYQYQLARKAFVQSIGLGFRGLRDRAGKAEGSYRFTLSRCYGLGNASLSYSEASNADALSHVVAARVLLQGTKARYIDAYIDLVHASIILSAGSDDVNEIDKAILMIEDAYGQVGASAVLTQAGARGHGPYAVRVANRLALAHMRRAVASPENERKPHFDAALEFVHIVRNSSHAKRDSRAYCATYIIESRIHREAKEFDKALASAQEALNVGESMDFTRIDCYITLGEAMFAKGDYAGAVDAFKRALKDGNTNRKIFAICHLHLSQTYLKAGEPSTANVHFRTWEETGRGLENAFISSLAETIRKDLRSLFNDFTIAKDVKDLDHERHLNALRKWLAERALVRADDNYKAAAGLLSVKSETTVKNWMKG
jgi:tetratricopeptide (TPR) repeat protein